MVRPGEDSPWQMMRGGQVDLSGPSARTSAQYYVAESMKGTVFRRVRSAGAPIHAPSDTKAIPGAPEASAAALRAAE